MMKRKTKKFLKDKTQSAYDNYHTAFQIWKNNPNAGNNEAIKDNEAGVGLSKKTGLNINNAIKLVATISKLLIKAIVSELDDFKDNKSIIGASISKRIIIITYLKSFLSKDFSLSFFTTQNML